ncbi:hypothetical protein GCM10028777_08210 [Angustibacter speluncae]
MSEHPDRPSRRTVLGAAAGVVVGATTVTAAPAAAAPPALADESARASARGIECVADLR